MITSAICNSFKTELLTATHNLTSHTIKVALYSSTATLNASTTAYTTTGEVTGDGYSAGGATLSGASISLSGNTAIVDFSDASWPASTITARGALIYNSSAANRAIAVLDFGTDRMSTNTTFTVTFPTADANSAIIRLA